MNSLRKADWSLRSRRSSISCRLNMAARNTTRLTMAAFARQLMTDMELAMRKGMAAVLHVSTI